MAYTFQGYINAWARSLFGVLVAFLVLSVFNSWFLAAMAFAFLFFIPLQNSNAERIVNGALFGLIMLVILAWAFGGGGSGLSGMGLGLDTGGGWPVLAYMLLVGFVIAAACAAVFGRSWIYMLAFLLLIATIAVAQPWNWNTSAIVFMAVWTVSTVIGISGDHQTKASVGVIALIISFVIYAGGVGTQEVGGAFFGQWWPQVHGFWNGIYEPLSNAITPLLGTIGNAWGLMTNPVGYATQLMNGTHAPNPGGETGVHGVDIASLETGRAFVNQPYVVSAVLKNNGAHAASGISARLEIDPTKLKLYSGSTDTSGLRDIAVLGMTNWNKAVKGGGGMEKLDMEQVVFQSEAGGISCEPVNRYEMRKKAIPLKLTTTYNYEADSRVSVEFMQQGEWERLTRENRLNLRDVRSEYSSAPVKFPIGTAGLKQPILARVQPFNIGLRLEAEASNSMINNATNVTLYYPADFGNADCTPRTGAPKAAGTGLMAVEWTAQGTEAMRGGGTKVFFCTFNPLAGDKMGSSPTKTYEVRAYANYSFSHWRTAEMALEFGGVCCKGGGEGRYDCLNGQNCHDCVCMPKEQATETGCRGLSPIEPTCKGSINGYPAYCIDSGKNCAVEHTGYEGTADYTCEVSKKCCIFKTVQTTPAGGTIPTTLP